MGEVLSARTERLLLRWRTRMGRETAMEYLDALVMALRPKGWRFVGYYRSEEFLVPLPLLWVYANGVEDLGIVVSVLATPGGTWAYHEAPRGRRGYLYPCDDVAAAAAVIDDLLRHRVYAARCQAGLGR
ncbi:hypothetical protein ETD83_06890 [Actinomadura soli]|uniref:Uncharacterized protein n=1 Tax=Actinomadura soli TaxID=2508997 RepID=A0A5C4JH59_9ACTN|nr:hypothetical protein [Actinomadura soli]TMR05420.1 hypothetical protein ETD83_06890 [Actinomadura soli]